jgi:hypothetical protein
MGQITNCFGNSIVNRCRDEGCEFKAHGTKNLIVVKGEKLCPNRKVCDCIIFVPRGIRLAVFLVELKSSGHHVSHIIEQLTYGYEKAVEYLKDMDLFLLSDFSFLVLTKKRKYPQFTMLSESRIDRAGKKRILVKNCGFSLSELLKITT